jgi:hypothetical protein
MPGTPRKKAAIAGPKGKKTAPKPPVEQLERLQALIVATLEDDKAEEIVVVDLAGRASFADRMIIASGLADRQIAALCICSSRRRARSTGWKRCGPPSWMRPAPKSEVFARVIASPA